MADDNAQLQVHPEPVEVHREAEVKSSVAPASDTEQDSGTYDGVDNASLSSDNTTNSDLYTDTEDQPEQEPESVYEEVNPTEAGNSQAAPGTDGAKTEETPTATEQGDNKDTKEKKKKKTPGCTGNLFSCMKKPGSKKKKETTKKEGTEEPVEENKEKTEKKEQKEVEDKEEKNIYEGIKEDEGEYVTIAKGEA
ncbi:uncharacterized protein LOC144927252 [Branchiostoma floridae x Branchiostoma belcheri]